MKHLKNKPVNVYLQTKYNYKVIVVEFFYSKMAVKCYIDSKMLTFYMILYY